jgi:hypothetical protein
MKELQQQSMKKPASVIERWKMMLAFLNDETTFNSWNVKNKNPIDDHTPGLSFSRGKKDDAKREK